MSDTTVQTRPEPAHGQGSAARDLRNLEKVRTIFISMSKYLSAKTIYASNNPNLINFARAFYEAFRAFFEDEKELLLTIEQYTIRWRDEIVYESDQKAESVAFLLYKDGIGELIIQSSVMADELERFVDLVRNEIHNPSPYLDIVSRFWQAEFADISYRVFDEHTDGTSKEGRGSGSELGEQQLQVNDHHGLPGTDECNAGLASRPNMSLESLDRYFYGAVERISPQATPHETEAQIQNILGSLFTVNPDDLQSWRDEYAAANQGNKLVRLFRIMLDFAQERRSPDMVRDILNILERLLHYAVEEADPPTLIALLEIHGEIAHSRTLAVDFQSVPGRMEDVLKSRALILSLGKATNRSHEGTRLVLKYFQTIGIDAVPGVCELLAHLSDVSLHKDACGTLITIAGDDLARIVEGFNLDNPSEASDAIYLLERCATGDVPPMIKKLASSPHTQVRERVIEYLARIRTDEAAQLLCTLIGDDDLNVRVKALATAEEFRHPLIIDRVTTLCFVEDVATKGAEELEHMFRAVGKLAGEDALCSTKRMIGKGLWLFSGRTRRRQNKLPAITALRHIPGDESRRLLRKLAKDGDHLVRTKALHALKQREASDAEPSEEQTLTGSKAAG